VEAEACRKGLTSDPTKDMAWDMVTHPIVLEVEWVFKTKTLKKSAEASKSAR